ncbi:MAG TPA: hypothetical protein VFB74_05765 [Kribbellaceae bacterium]|nr:hypothetical protein [Kribbellaceae bacterium]
MPRLSEEFDEFGNPRGRAFDLGGGDEVRVRGERILFYACSIPDGRFAESQLRKVMAERDLQLDVLHAPGNGPCSLTEQLLARYTQLWYVSGQTPTLSGQQVQAIVKFVQNGNGLAIWADNEPFFADANLLAQALIGTSFSGNRQADQIMVPGGKLAPGRFVEHPLTQGVNNLYEGITICTIQPAPGVTILGQSHDGQLCFGCLEREGQRIVLETGFTKLYDRMFNRSAGLGRYLSNIAFWLARGSRGVEYQLLTPGRERIETITKGASSKDYQFTVAKSTVVTCILQWDGKATLQLTVRAPDGGIARRDQSRRSPLRVQVPTRTPGTWVAQVNGIDVVSDRVPYVVTLLYENDRQAGGAPATQGVIPFYFVCDISAATASSITDLNAAVRYIQRDLTKDPAVDSRVAMCVIAFNDSACTVAPLAAPSKIVPPQFTASGGRSYGAALREYHRTFERDRARLAATGAKILRPCVFFLTQGEPDDADYAEALRSLLGYDPTTKHGNRAYPIIVAIGLGSVSPQRLAKLAYPDFGDVAKRGRWFLAEPGIAARQTLRSVADAICRSVRETVASAAEGSPRFIQPESISGATSGAAGPDNRS